MPDYGDVDPTTGRTSARTAFEGSVDPLAPSVANGQITPEQWAQYQARRRRDFLLGVLGLAGGTIGASALSGVLTGSGGVLASTPTATGIAPYAGTVSATGTGIGGAAAGGAAAMAPLSATPFTSLTPYAGTVAGTGTGMGAAGGVGGIGAAGGAAAESELRRFLGMSGRDLLALGGAGVGAIGALTSDRPTTSPTTATSDPNMQRLLQSMQRRLDMSEPLYGSVMSMANGLLPTQYQKGGGGMG